MMVLDETQSTKITYVYEKGRRTIIGSGTGREMKETIYSLTIYHTGSLYNKEK